MACKKCNSNKCKCDAKICINPLISMFKGADSLVGTDSVNFNIQEIFSSIIQKRSLSRNGLKELYQKAIVTEAALSDIKNESFIYDLPLALTETLTNGISIANNKNLCCPDCTNGIYFLGSVERFIYLFENTLKSNIRYCCIEHYASVEAIINLKESISYPTCCNTDFPEAVDQWINSSSSISDYFYLDDVTNEGIIESSSFNGYSGLGILFNYLQLTKPELTSEDYLNILGVIANLGIVIQCNGCEIIIGSVDTYLDYFKSSYGRINTPA